MCDLADLRKKKRKLDSKAEKSSPVRRVLSVVMKDCDLFYIYKTVNVKSVKDLAKFIQN